MKWQVWIMIGLAFAATLAFLWIVKAPILSSYFSGLLGMDVSIGGVSITPGEMQISNFRIGNPGKYKERAAFKADSIVSSYHWNQLRSDPSTVERIEMDRIQLNIEFLNPTGKQNNWTEIAANIPKRDANAKEVIIKRLILTNMTVKIIGMGIWAKRETRTIGRMELTNISSKSGFPTRELISNIFGNAGLIEYIKNIIPSPGGVIKMLPPLFGRYQEKGQADECLALHRTSGNPDCFFNSPCRLPERQPVFPALLP